MATKRNPLSFFISIATTSLDSPPKFYFKTFNKKVLFLFGLGIPVFLGLLGIGSWVTFNREYSISEAKHDYAQILIEKSKLKKEEHHLSEQTSHLTRTTIKYFMLAGLEFRGGIPHGGRSLSENDISDQLSLLKKRQQKLLAYIQDNTEKWLHTPSIPPAEGRISSKFGFRKSPFSNGREFHKGLDIANFAGTPILATAAGKVVLAGKYMGYGNTVVIDHGYGIRTLYGHMRQILVKNGQLVKRGDLIGKMGNTGLSTGPHVHYSVMVENVPVDPQKFMFWKEGGGF